MDLGNIRPGMEVVGSHGERLGTVDRVDGNRMEPRRNDPAAEGRHHRLAQDAIASADGSTVRLSAPASEARRSWQGEAPSPRGG